MAWFKNLFKMNLRKKLIIYFILIVVIPLIFYFVFFNILGAYLNNSASIEEVDTVIEEFENGIRDNINLLKNPQEFKSSIDSLLTEYQGELQIIDPETDMIVLDTKGS
ncbi:MAG TPA: hypothetical protein VKN64_09265, partial [Halanaerobiales bacterium]|nr:hypothetical protein [Halanaerobiales bacterium]